MIFKIAAATTIFASKRQFRARPSFFFFNSTARQFRDPRFSLDNVVVFVIAVAQSDQFH